MIFDPSNLSDEDLIQKQIDLQERISIAYNSGNYVIVGNLQKYLQQIQMEQLERIVKQSIKSRSDLFPDIIESDPDFQIEKKQEPFDKQTPKTNRNNILKTKRPTKG